MRRATILLPMLLSLLPVILLTLLCKANIDANAAADAAESAAGAAADAAMADDIDDNEFRIAAAAADMGFGTSTVGISKQRSSAPRIRWCGEHWCLRTTILVEADFVIGRCSLPQTLLLMLRVCCW